MDELVEKKALLTLGGGVKLPEGFELPVRVSRSTAGPGAGFGSVAFSFGNGRFRVKKSFSYDSGEFELHVADDGRMSLTRGGEPFLDDVRLEPVVRHCPEQAFFDLDPRCKYHCAFCSSPILDPEDVKHLDADRILEMLDESVGSLTVKAVSFTSGVYGDEQETVDRLAEVVRRTRERYPDLPIGVEPYVSSTGQLEELKAAGADEIKLNITSPRRDIFAKVCPDLDYDNILRNLENAVGMFGRGRVITNVIYGFGETDEDLAAFFDEMCAKGVIPGARALRINSYNRGPLADALGGAPAPTTPERVVRVAELQKEAMQRHGLTSLTSVTMCLECGCCDIVPFRDLRCGCAGSLVVSDPADGRVQSAG